MLNLFFDLDDTLVDATGMMVDAVAATARRFGARISAAQTARVADVYLHANLAAWRAARPADPGFSMEIVWTTCWARTVLQLEIDIPVQEIVPVYRELRAAVAPRLFSETEAVIDALRSRGHRLGLITNGPSDVQRRKLAQYGLTDAFDPIVISQEAGHAKPDPRIFQEAARRAGAEASACVMVGDLLFADVRGGRASGWRTVWVRRARDIGPEHARLDECAEEERPHDVVGDLNGLLDLFAE